MAIDILVTDDEEMIRWTLKEALEQDGYNVLTFETGRKFLSYFNAHGGDIILLDVRLPDANGLDLLLEIKKDNPEAIVVIMTAFGDVETAVSAMKRGAFDYLAKPYSLEEVSLLIKKIVQANLLKSQLSHYQERFENQFARILGEDPKMKQLKEHIGMTAKSDKTTVLIRGESGTGKELVARQIHFKSQRADKPFIDVNAAAVSSTLLESELFGHEKGAFTDAQKQRKGLFELANGGTLFLDEIGDLDPSLQVKLLRVLEERKFRRVGGTSDIHVDVRIISATNADLEKAMEDGRLRKDLFYRLNVFNINLPPLRERPDDVMLLAKYFLDQFRKDFRKKITGFKEETINILKAYDYPGNVRELRNIIERATLLETDSALRPACLPEELKNSAKIEKPIIQNYDCPQDDMWQKPGFDFKSYIESVEKKIICDAMKHVNYKKSEAAKMLGLSRFALRHQLKKHSLDFD